MGETLFTWHRFHRFPGAALNLTWNLNQEGRFHGDPWEGHSCVGTQWGRHASWPPREAAQASSLSRQNWGHQCLPWPEAYSVRMGMVNTVYWHHVMSQKSAAHLWFCWMVTFEGWWSGKYIDQELQLVINALYTVVPVCIGCLITKYCVSEAQFLPLSEQLLTPALNYNINKQWRTLHTNTCTYSTLCVCVFLLVNHI